MPANSGRTARWIPDQVRDDDHCGWRYVGPMPATPAWPPRSAPRLFVPGPLTMGATVSLEGNQAHYLAKVMRVAEGDTVVLCDDQTGEWAARVVSAGKRAVTHWRRLRHLRDATLVECTLETGRTHQVRVHMASIGCPLLGDPVYGRTKQAHRKVLETLNFRRQALHAARLGFIHPITSTALAFESEMPADMQELFDTLSY